MVSEQICEQISPFLKMLEMFSQRLRQSIYWTCLPSPRHRKTAFKPRFQPRYVLKELGVWRQMAKFRVCSTPTQPLTHFISASRFLFSVPHSLFFNFVLFWCTHLEVQSSYFWLCWDEIGRVTQSNQGTMQSEKLTQSPVSQVLAKFTMVAFWPAGLTFVFA